MQNLLSPIDFLLAPIYLIIFSFIATRFKNKNLKAGPYYRFYLQGLWAKMLGGLAVCLIYAYYYKGGDTLNYFIEARTYVNVFLEGDYNMLWELINFKTYPISSVNYGSYENCEFIFIKNLPQFNENNSNQQQRFITLVDILYEKKISLLVSSKSQLDSITSSNNLRDVFKRTISRLHELTSTSYDLR